MSTKAYAARNAREARQLINAMRAAGHTNIALVGPSTSVDARSLPNARWLVVGSNSDIRVVP